MKSHLKKVYAAIPAACLVSSAMAQVTVATAVDDVEAITTTATTGYLAAVVLGVGALSVGAIVYFSKKGWKLR